MTLEELNQLPPSDALALFYGCCHCQSWSEKMVSSRPFTSVDQMLDVAQQKWQSAQEDDLLEAFSGHARIGDMNALRDKYSQASREQGQIVRADESVLENLLALNEKYEQKNGFIFIVYATGKTAAEMLDLLRARLEFSREEELQHAAAEQAKITGLRLYSLVVDQ